MAYQAFSDPNDAAAAGWGTEDQRRFDEIVGSMSEYDRNLILGSGMAGDAGEEIRKKIRDKVLNETRDQKQQGLETAYTWGSDPGNARRDWDYYRAQAEAAQGRQGERIDFTGALGNRENALRAREKQLGMADLMERRAMGLVPSIAEMQADRQMQQAAAEQSSAAASARGAAGIALAQQNAAGNTAAMQSAISNQAQINAAQERMAAEQAAYGAYSGMRQQDYGGQTIDAQMAQAQAQINAAQRAQNDAYSQGMYGNEQQVKVADLQARGNRQAAVTGQQQSAIALQQQRDARDRQQTNQTVGMIGQGVMTGISLGMASDVTAKQNIVPLSGAVGGSIGGGGLVGRMAGAPPPMPYDPRSAGAMLGGASPSPHAAGLVGAQVAPAPPPPTGPNPAVMGALRMGANMFGSLASGGGYGMPQDPVVPYGGYRGGYGGGFYSDERSKSNAVNMGFAAGLMANGDPDPIRTAKAGAWDEGHRAALDDARKLAAMPPSRLRELAEQGHPLAATVREMRASAWDEGHRAPPRDPRHDAMRAQALGLLGDVDAQRHAASQAGPSVGGSDPVTQQFAQGLSPAMYHYRPGVPGTDPARPQVGPASAQEMARHPVTAPAVQRDPATGLLAIDGAGGTKLALAGVGHLAQKQQLQDEVLAGLMADRVQRYR